MTQKTFCLILCGPALISAIIFKPAEAVPKGIFVVYDFIENVSRAQVSNVLTDIAPKSAASNKVEMLAIYEHPTNLGEAVVNYKVKLPKIEPEEFLLLSFYFGLSDGIKFEDEEHPFDGVRFAVEIEDERVFSEDRKILGWAYQCLDLRKYQGKEVSIKFITYCLRNANYDWAHWGKPRILHLKGNSLPSGDFADLSNLGLPEGWEVYNPDNLAQVEDLVKVISEDVMSGKTALRIKARNESPIGLILNPKFGISAKRGLALFSYKAVASEVKGENLQFCFAGFDKDGNKIQERAVYTVSPEEVGDGRWHQVWVPFDFLDTKAAYVTIGIKINREAEKVPSITSSPQRRAGKGEIIVDNIALFSHLPVIKVCAFNPVNALIFPQRDFELSCTLQNVGEAPVEPAHDIAVTLSLPPDFQLISPKKTYPIEELNIQEKKEFRWRVRSPNKPQVASLKLQISGKDLSQVVSTYPLEITPPLVNLPKKPPRKPQVIELKNALILENQKIRFVFPKGLEAYNYYVIYVWNSKKWHPLGTSSYPMGKIICKTADGSIYNQGISSTKYAIIQNNRDTASLELIGNTEDKDKVRYEIAFRFTLKSKENKLLAEYSLKADKERQLLFFQGPTILAGEQSFGGKKSDALFPGLEWLVGEEVSSSTLDAQPPHNLRWAPHPLHITIPMMALTHGKYLLGLMWDPLQKWDGENILPGVKFASPNWLQGQENHLLGLFLPAVPRWVPPNQEQAKEPYILKPGVSIKVQAYIFADYPADLMQSFHHWFEAFGSPTLQTKPRDYEKEIELARQAYLKTVWVEEAKGWGHCQGWPPGPFPTNCLILWLDSCLTRNEETKRTLRDRINLVVDHILKTAGPGGLMNTASCHIPIGWELPFYVGHLEEAFRIAKESAKGIIKSQQLDGSWRFQPDENRQVLGAPGETAIGLCAHPTYMLLHWARMTADEEFLEAGLKGLKFMDQFRVPRAAQTWECPLHSPDILASAHAVLAYLEAYKITGDKHYLEKAKYWGYTGLPFVYFWTTDDRPVMKYSTIPIFGATFFTWPWFGRPVQWCGLVYAYALQKLAQYDQTMPWKTIGEGITISGMHQQIDRGDLLGTYPDSWGLVENRPGGPFINPEAIIKNVYALIGHDLDLKTVILKKGKARIQINSAAEIKNARFDASRNILSFSLNYFAGETSYSLIASLPKPKSILKDNQEIPYSEDLEKVPEGWKYLSADGFVYLKIKYREPSVDIKLTALKF